MRSIMGVRGSAADNRILRTFLIQIGWRELFIVLLCMSTSMVQAADVASDNIDVSGLQREYLLASAAGKATAGPVNTSVQYTVDYQ